MANSKQNIDELIKWAETQKELNKKNATDSMVGWSASSSTFMYNGKVAAYVELLEKLNAAKDYWFEHFKAQEQKPVWVKCVDKMPNKIENICRKIGYIDIMDSYDFHQAVKRGDIKAEEWEWLNEQPQQPLADEEIWVLAEKEYPKINYSDGDKLDSNMFERDGFVKGFKAALKLK